jgi:hypothetical protein
MDKIDFSPWQVPHATKLRLNEFDTSPPEELELDEDDLKHHQTKLEEKLNKLQSLFYSSKSKAILLILQGMDTSGKDGVIRHVFSHVSPLGMHAIAFGAPTEVELRHDFLWRIQYNQQRQSTWPECRTVRQFLSWPLHLQEQIGLDPKDFYLGKNSSANVWQDIHGIKVILSTARTFQGSAVKYDPETQTLKLRNSRPEDAIQVCTFKPCHHFIQGQLYKCGPVGILPEFVQQFPVQMTDQERQILHSYVPARADWDQQQLEQFILGLKNADPIAQCRFCPDHVTIQDGGPTTNAYRKKIKIKAI